ncbi:hypothetical protein [Okeania sp. SIO2C9]|uniref:hypothetical protein n=1 Tax=Okeania sp. SIO2C9 TaxID=2607791 RepID=UPI0025DAE204|nr:hypothetical protein [Okeania sp. SIO2C9]
MSVVAAKKYSDRLMFASDSLRVSGHLKENYRVTGGEQAKLFEINDLVIGGVGLIMELSFMQIFARNHKPAAPTVEAVLDLIVEFYTWAKSIDHYNFLLTFDCLECVLNSEETSELRTRF